MASPDLLNTWKDVARYLDRSVRTAQRWEAELELPVRRPPHRRTVIAVRSDIDEWLKKLPVTSHEHRDGIDDLPKYNTSSPHEVSGTLDLILRSRVLCEEFSQSRLELRSSIHQLTTNLQNMQKSHLLRAFEHTRELFSSPMGS
jgi:hypothetical protein